MNPTGGADILLDSIQRTKRETVVVACQSCRRRKQKCNGQRPCERCSQAGQVCVFESAENETPRQTQKRKFEQMEAELNVLRELIRSMVDAGEKDAMHIVKRLCEGQSPSTICTALQSSASIEPSTNIAPERRDLILTLLQSTDSLESILSYVNRIADSRLHMVLPSNTAHRRLRSGLVNHEKLEFLFSSAETSYFPLEIPRNLYAPGRSYNGPLVWVRSSNWLDIPASDDVVSHLISLFLTFFNTYWRFVEEDDFLRGLRGSANDRNSPCSSLLVLAMLSCTSLYSEHGEVFTSSHDCARRGLHFYQEAIRQWGEESEVATITNAQAAMILAVAAQLRGQDRMGHGFVLSAVHLNHTIQTNNNSRAAASGSGDEAARRRACLNTAVTHLQVSYCNALLQPCSGVTSWPKCFSDINEIMSRPAVYWIPYPIQREPTPFYPAILMHHRYGLTQLAYDLNALMVCGPEPDSAEHFWHSSKDLFRRLQHWYYSLPGDLRYMREMPASIYELHCHYYCLQMQLSDLTFKRLPRGHSHSSEAHSNEIPREVQSELNKNGLLYALSAGQAACDYRDMYGLTIAAPFVQQAAAHAMFTFLRFMQATPQESNTAANIHNIENAFTDCYRLLSAGSVMSMQNRGIMRMILGTAGAIHAILPTAVEHARVVLDVTPWQSADALKLGSMYPNWACAREPGNVPPQYEMDQLLQGWYHREVSPVNSPEEKMQED